MQYNDIVKEFEKQRNVKKNLKPLKKIVKGRWFDSPQWIKALKIQTKQPLEWEKIHNEWIFVSQLGESDRIIYARLSTKIFIVYNDDGSGRNVNPMDVSLESPNIHLDIIKIVFQTLKTKLNLNFLVNLGMTCKAMMYLINNQDLWNDCFGFNNMLDNVARFCSIPSFLPSIKDIPPFAIISDLFIHKPYEGQGHKMQTLDLFTPGTEHNDILLMGVQTLLCTMFVQKLNESRDKCINLASGGHEIYQEMSDVLKTIEVPLTNVLVKYTIIWFKLQMGSSKVGRCKRNMTLYVGNRNGCMINCHQTECVMQHIFNTIFTTPEITIDELVSQFIFIRNRGREEVSLMTLLYRGRK